MRINAEMIRSLRNQKGWSIRKLSELSGVSRGLISDLENKQSNNVTIVTLCKLSKALDVKPEELYSCD